MEWFGRVCCRFKKVSMNLRNPFHIVVKEFQKDLRFLFLACFPYGWNVQYVPPDPLFFLLKRLKLRICLLIQLQVHVLSGEILIIWPLTMSSTTSRETASTPSSRTAGVIPPSDSSAITIYHCRRSSSPCWGSSSCFTRATFTVWLKVARSTSTTSRLRYLTTDQKEWKYTCNRQKWWVFVIKHFKQESGVFHLNFCNYNEEYMQEWGQYY